MIKTALLFLVVYSIQVIGKEDQMNQFGFGGNGFNGTGGNNEIKIKREYVKTCFHKRWLAQDHKYSDKVLKKCGPLSEKYCGIEDVQFDNGKAILLDCFYAEGFCKFKTNQRVAVPFTKLCGKSQKEQCYRCCCDKNDCNKDWTTIEDCAGKEPTHSVPITTHGKHTTTQHNTKPNGQTTSNCDRKGKKCVIGQEECKSCQTCCSYDHDVNCVNKEEEQDLKNNADKTGAPFRCGKPGSGNHTTTSPPPPCEDISNSCNFGQKFCNPCNKTCCKASKKGSHHGNNHQCFNQAEIRTAQNQGKEVTCELQALTCNDSLYICKFGKKNCKSCGSTCCSQTTKGKTDGPYCFTKEQEKNLKKSTEQQGGTYQCAGETKCTDAKVKCKLNTNNCAICKEDFVCCSQTTKGKTGVTTCISKHEEKVQKDQAKRVHNFGITCDGDKPQPPKPETHSTGGPSGDKGTTMGASTLGRNRILAVFPVAAFLAMKRRL